MNLLNDLNLPIQNNVPLCRYSTFQVGGIAQHFSTPANREQLIALFEFRKRAGIPYVVVGRGSNILFPDEGFAGLVISLQKYEVDRVFFNANQTVKASAGVSLFRLSALCQERAASGLEFVCHIPGTVGGAVWMNAGFGRPGRAYVEIKDVLEWITVIDSEGKAKVLRRDEIEFEYRSSNLKNCLVLDATFHVSESTRDIVREEVRANFAYRNSVQDLRYPSAGSIFKNPKKTSGFSSGQLIDKVGLKGFRIGGAMFSEKHGNFIVNVGQAKAADVTALIHLAQARVRDTYGIELEPEVKVITPETNSETVEVGILA